MKSKRFVRDKIEQKTDPECRRPTGPWSLNAPRSQPASATPQPSFCILSVDQYRSAPALLKPYNAIGRRHTHPKAMFQDGFSILYPNSQIRFTHQPNPGHLKGRVSIGCPSQCSGVHRVSISEAKIWECCGPEDRDESASFRSLC